MVNLDEFGIPSPEFVVGRPVLVGITVDVLLAILQNLGEDLAGDFRKGDDALTAILDLGLIVCDCTATASSTSKVSPSQLFNVIFFDVDAIAQNRGGTSLIEERI
ncbi:hypothetical protein SLE2022_042330 [Rubroshorea leprosula]